MTIEPGSIWRPKPGWYPQDAIVGIDDVRGSMVHFRDWTGTRATDECNLHQDLFLETYEPMPDVDTLTPSMFEEVA